MKAKEFLDLFSTIGVFSWKQVENVEKYEIPLSVPEINANDLQEFLKLKSIIKTEHPDVNVEFVFKIDRKTLEIWFFPRKETVKP